MKLASYVADGKPAFGAVVGDGVVTLKGTVPTFSDRRAAESAAWLAKGVSMVRDELAVG